jgi:hypothetical protein
MREPRNRIFLIARRFDGRRIGQRIQRRPNNKQAEHACQNPNNGALIHHWNELSPAKTSLTTESRDETSRRSRSNTILRLTTQLLVSCVLEARKQSHPTYRELTRKRNRPYLHLPQTHRLPPLLSRRRHGAEFSALQVSRQQSARRRGCHVQGCQPSAQRIPPSHTC